MKTGYLRKRVFTIILLLLPLLFIPAEGKAQKVAIWRIDALGGLSKEIVHSLESLLTQEMGRIAEEIVPSTKTIAIQKKYRHLRKCQGANRCLAKIGRYLKARYIVTGNLASLGKHYVVTLKLVNSKNGKSIRSISEPLSGKAENLIVAVRLAAYKLLAPQKLLGSLQLIVNHAGAKIIVDGKYVGKSPLRSPLTGLKVGKHSLKILHDDFLDLVRKVDVRFQKTTTVRINLVKPPSPKNPLPKKPTGPIVKDHPTPFYSKWWFWAAVGVGAAAIGATAGWAIGKAFGTSSPEVINCDNGACVGGNMP